MNCPFCNNETKLAEGVGDTNQYGWYDCRMCDVSLLTHTTTNRIISHMYHRQIKDKYYAILSDHTVQRLRVGCPTLADKNIIVDCEYPISSITPTNVMSKLQTLLLFL